MAIFREIHQVQGFIDFDRGKFGLEPQEPPLGGPSTWKPRPPRGDAAYSNKTMAGDSKKFWRAAHNLRAGPCVPTQSNTWAWRDRRVQPHPAVSPHVTSAGIASASTLARKLLIQSCAEIGAAAAHRRLEPYERHMTVWRARPRCSTAW